MLGEKPTSFKPVAIRHRKYRLKNRIKLLKLIGDKCLICNSTEHLIFHEIHGTPHKNTEPTFYLKNPQNFVTLCYFHHRLVHALMDLNPDAREKINKLT
jgi:hypothetical protein